MLKTFLRRPIGVLMSMLALVIFSILAVIDLPVSLLPDMDTPRLIIYLKKQGFTPVQWEENIMGDLRQRLRTTLKLSDWKAESQSDEARIQLYFEQNTNMDLAFLEVNEKIDQFYAANNALLDDRPLVVRQNSTDVPLMRIQLSPNKETSMNTASDLARKIIKRRLERLEGISIIDLSGTHETVIQIDPNNKKLIDAGIDVQSLITAIKTAGQKLGNISVASGNYLYNLQVDATVQSIEELKVIPVPISEEKQLPLSYFTEINYLSKPGAGYHLFQAKDAVVLNVHKQPSAQIAELESMLRAEITELEKEYPQYSFNITRNQSIWLTSSMENLVQSLFFGGVSAVLLLFIFMGNWRLGAIMALNLPITVLLSFLLFYLLGLTINLISLAGIALGVGMLIDNTIIVIDNMEQKFREFQDLKKAAWKGTTEVMSALISSVLTTLAVFIPLMLMGGIAGALFYDQAVSIAIILSVSLLVSFIFTPVLYSLLHSGRLYPDSLAMRGSLKAYTKIFKWTMNNKWSVALIFLLIPLISFFLITKLEVKGMPEIFQSDWQVKMNWPDKVTSEENRKRTIAATQLLQDISAYHEADVSKSEFILSSENISPSESRIYFHLKDSIEDLQWLSKLRKEFTGLYPQTKIEISPAPNAFDHIFTNQDPYYELRFRRANNNELIDQTLAEEINQIVPSEDTEGSRGFTLERSFALSINEQILQNSGVSRDQLYKGIDQIWGLSPIAHLSDPGARTAIFLRKDSSNYRQMMNKTLLRTENNDYYPLRELIEVVPNQSLTLLPSDRNGHFQSKLLSKPLSESQLSELKVWAAEKQLSADAAGTYFKDQEQIKQLAKILGISLLLLYFILCAQFESFLQPLVVLLIVPLGLFGSILGLYLMNDTINLMAGIGIIIVTGIMVNDSILKVDTYNRFLKESKLSIDQIIKEVGKLRLKPILLTTFTTILAILPILFFDGLGADLQFSMVVAIIGGLSLGTTLSLFILPIMYKWVVSAKLKR